jgi:hypothetical protein
VGAWRAPGVERTVIGSDRLTLLGPGWKPTRAHAETTSLLMFPQQVDYIGDSQQQYLAKNPDGYCGLGGCGVTLDV